MEEDGIWRYFDYNRDRIEEVWKGVRERRKEREIRRSAIKRSRSVSSYTRYKNRSKEWRRKGHEHRAREEG